MAEATIKISEFSETPSVTDSMYIPVIDGTNNYKLKAQLLQSTGDSGTSFEKFSLNDDLAGGSGTISSSVFERLTSARQAKDPIIVINDNGSLPVANIAILSFGHNEQQQGTTDIIMPARINDLEDYTINQTVYQITGGGSTYNITTVNKNIQIKNSGDGTQFLGNDGQYHTIESGGQSQSFLAITVDSLIESLSGTIDDGLYQKIDNAITNQIPIYGTDSNSNSIVPLYAGKDSTNIILIQSTCQPSEVIAGSYSETTTMVSYVFKISIANKTITYGYYLHNFSIYDTGTVSVSSNSLSDTVDDSTIMGISYAYSQHAQLIIFDNSTGGQRYPAINLTKQDDKFIFTTTSINITDTNNATLTATQYTVDTTLKSCTTTTFTTQLQKTE